MKAFLLKILKSRTFWTAAATFLVNGMAAIKMFMPPQYLVLVDALLLALTTYFHINPSQKY